MEAVFGPFVTGATLSKHQGFREEREVRIVAMPASKHLLKLQKAELPNFQFPPLKTVRTRPSTNGPRRFVVLFDTLNAKLPIEKVIVGPSKDQGGNYTIAKDLLPPTVSVSRSSTPFRG